MARWIALAFVGILITGCAGVANKPFTPSAKLESVAVLEVPEFNDYVLSNYSAGTIGLVATKTAHEGDLRKSISSAGFNFRHEFTKELVAALKASGLRVEMVAVTRKKQELLESYDRVQTTADAILDVAAVTVGYETENALGRKDYRPSIPRLSVALVDKASGKVLYSEAIKYGSKNTFISGTEITAPEGTYFPTAKELLEGDNAARGLRTAIKHISQLIAEKLRQGNAQVRIAQQP